MNHTQLYGEKDQPYFHVRQKWVADLISGRNLRILDVGCGDGQTAVMLKQVGIAREIHGIELVPEAAERANSLLDSVIQGDIETLELPYSPASFDVIVATEVLEHLVNPWEIVRKLRRYLTDDGIMIASVPNIGNISVIWNLIRGRWQYTDSGIMDKTHLRFFTRQTFVDLFDQAEMDVDTIQPIMHHRIVRLNNLLLGLPERLLAQRYKCRARKNEIWNR